MVTFDPASGAFTDDDSTEMRTALAAPGAKLSAPDVSRGGYVLLGWWNGDTKWDFAADAVTGDMTLTAHWEASAGANPKTGDPGSPATPILLIEACIACVLAALRVSKKRVL